MLRICMPTSEFAPFAKTGGLADVTAGLSAFLTDIGQDVRVFMPYYKTIDLKGTDVHVVEHLTDIPIKMGDRTFSYNVHTARVPDSEQWIYLIECPELYDREGFYCDADGDEHLRFGFFSQAVLHTCQRMGWKPDIIHSNDWHTALIPLYLRTVFSWDDLFSRTKTILTIHNVAYQGIFAADTLHPLGFGSYTSLLHQEDLRDGIISFMKSGVIYADMLTTVSPTYARELQTEQYGMGLGPMFEARVDRLRGILNGVDYGAWSPEADHLIPHHYSSADLAGKERCKQSLLESLGLSYEVDVPTIGLVSRLTQQKGFDLAFTPLREVLAREDVRVAVLGSGESDLEESFSWLQRTFPSKVCFYRGYNNELAHQIEAGSDMFLMPSRFEPCGLNQMYSLRYGTPPIVRDTGGLADTVTHWNSREQSGNGFVFEHETEQGVRWALGCALEAYRDRRGWTQLMRNGMACEYSWERQGREYLTLYADMMTAA